MIIREEENNITMIEQHNHAQISAEALKHWADSAITNDPLFSSVLYAVRNHDIGWASFDKQPFWNDEKAAPYAFTDFPALPKTVLYKHGINEVEKYDLYAALLCSEHYTRFMMNNPSEGAAEFVNGEKLRQIRIKKALHYFDEQQFSRHYSLLQFADNLSLFICLNKPGASGEEQHPFFKKGIPVSPAIMADSCDVMEATWQDEDTVVLSPFPFYEQVPVTIQYKVLSKKEIAEAGFLQAYENSPYKEKGIEIGFHQ